MTYSDRMKPFNDANLLYDKRKYDKALQKYHEAVELNPYNPDVYNNRGNTYKNLGFYDEAIRDFNKTIELAPGYCIPYNNRGTVYHAKKDYEMALKDYEMAIKLNPEYCTAHSNCGIIYRIKGDNEMALLYYEEANILDPSYYNAIIGMAYCFENMGRFDDATREYQKAINVRFPEYKHLELAKLAGWDQPEKCIETIINIIKNGFYLSITGKPGEYLFIAPDMSDRVILKLSKEIELRDEIINHIDKNKERYKFCFNSDSDAVFGKLQNKYKEDDKDILFFKSRKILFPLINKQNSEVKTVANSLYFDGELVAGDIGIIAGKVYTGISRFRKKNNSGWVFSYYLYQYLREKNFKVLDMGSDQIAFNSYKLSMGAEIVSLDDYVSLVKNMVK